MNERILMLMAAEEIEGLFFRKKYSMDKSVV